MRDVSRYAHPDCGDSGQIYERQIGGEADVRVEQQTKLALADRKFADRSIASVAHEGFEKANLKGGAEIEDAETLSFRQRTWVAEAACGFAETERGQISSGENATESVADSNCLQDERRGVKVGRRNRWHSGECLSDAFGGLDHFCITTL